MDIHTPSGVSISQMDKLEDIFLSYPMQRELGEVVFWYCFPACFLLPFICEPIFAIFVPLHLNALFVRSHPEVHGRAAEKALEFFLPMNLSRYSDILLNVLFSTLILFAPGGYVIWIFGLLFLCHLYIYLYDHYRVLRSTASFYYANTRVEDSR